MAVRRKLSWPARKVVDARKIAKHLLPSWDIYLILERGKLGKRVIRVSDHPGAFYLWADDAYTHAITHKSESS